jgi:hypothetical protein
MTRCANHHPGRWRDLSPPTFTPTGAVGVEVFLWVRGGARRGVAR